MKVTSPRQRPTTQLFSKICISYFIFKPSRRTNATKELVKTNLTRENGKLSCVQIIFLIQFLNLSPISLSFFCFQHFDQFFIKFLMSARKIASTEFKETHKTDRRPVTVSGQNDSCVYCLSMIYFCD